MAIRVRSSLLFIALLSISMISPSALSVNSSNVRNYIIGTVTSVNGSMLELFDGKFIIDASNQELSEIKVGTPVEIVYETPEDNSSPLVAKEILVLGLGKSETLQSRLQEVDLSTRSMKVLDQSIFFDDRTSFKTWDNRSLDPSELVIEKPVNIELRNDGSGLVASSVTQFEPSGIGSIEGTILDIQGNILRIVDQNLAVDLSRATISSTSSCPNLPLSSLHAGLQVSIRFSDNGLPLKAKEVFIPFLENEGILNGLLESTNLQSQNFRISGQNVSFDEETSFKKLDSSNFKSIDYPVALTELKPEKFYYIHFKFVRGEFVARYVVEHDGSGLSSKTIPCK